MDAAPTQRNAQVTCQVTNHDVKAQFGGSGYGSVQKPLILVDSYRGLYYPINRWI